MRRHQHVRPRRGGEAVVALRVRGCAPPGEVPSLDHSDAARVRAHDRAGDRNLRLRVHDAAADGGRLRHANRDRPFRRLRARADERRRLRGDHRPFRRHARGRERAVVAARRQRPAIDQDRRLRDRRRAVIADDASRERRARGERPIEVGDAFAEALRRFFEERVVGMQDCDRARFFRIRHFVLPRGVGLHDVFGAAVPQDDDRIRDRLSVRFDRAALRLRAHQRDRARFFVALDAPRHRLVAARRDAQFGDAFFRRLEREASLRVGLRREQRHLFRIRGEQPRAPRLRRFDRVNRDAGAGDGLAVGRHHGAADRREQRNGTPQQGEQSERTFHGIRYNAVRAEEFPPARCCRVS